MSLLFSASCSSWVAPFFFFLSFPSLLLLLRIKNKIFPPVPTPVIPNFTPYQEESQVRRHHWLTAVEAVWSSRCLKPSVSGEMFGVSTFSLMTCSLFTLIYSIIEHNFIVHSGRSLFHLSSSLSVSYSIKHPGECKTLKLVKCKAFSVIKKTKKTPLVSPDKQRGRVRDKCIFVGVWWHFNSLILSYTPVLWTRCAHYFSFRWNKKKKSTTISRFQS